jgi:hypothetical protein
LITPFKTLALGEKDLQAKPYLLPGSRAPSGLGATADADE